jgi:hypothetical protein
MWYRHTLCSVLALAFFAAELRAEFILDPQPDYEELHAEAAVHPNGEVLLTWSRQVDLSSPFSAMAAILDPNSGQLGELHEWGPGSTENAAPLGDGYLAVRRHVDIHSHTEWVVERLDASGRWAGTALPLGFIFAAVVHGTPDGGAVVVAAGVTGTGGPLQGWRFGADGAFLGGPITLADNSLETAAGVDGGGNLIAVWTDSRSRVFARRFSPELQPLGPVIPVAVGGGIRVAVAPDGRFVVLYAKPDLWVRPFNADGGPAGTRRLISPRFEGAGRPGVAIGPDGRILVIWQANENVGNLNSPMIRARFLSFAGRTLGGLFRLVKIPPGSGQLMHPRTESLPEGGFLVLWTLVNEAAGRLTLQGRRFN